MESYSLSWLLPLTILTREKLNEMKWRLFWRHSTVHMNADRCHPRLQGCQNKMLRWGRIEQKRANCAETRASEAAVSKTSVKGNGVTRRIRLWNQLNLTFFSTMFCTTAWWPFNSKQQLLRASQCKLKGIAVRSRIRLTAIYTLI
jgi:hypothetical protein